MLCVRQTFIVLAFFTVAILPQCLLAHEARMFADFYAAEPSDEIPLQYRIVRARLSNCSSRVQIHSLSSAFRTEFHLSPSELAEVLRWAPTLGFPAKSFPVWEWIGEGSPGVRAAGEAWALTSLLKHFFASEAPRLVYRRVLLGAMMVNGVWSLSVRNLDQSSLREERALRDHFHRLLRPLATTIPEFLTELAGSLPPDATICDAREWPELFVDQNFANGLSLTIHTGREAYARRGPR